MATAHILKMAGLVTACSVIGGAAWATLDYTELRPVLFKEYRMAQADTAEQLEEMSKAILLLKFTNLMEQQKRGRLTFDQQQELCRITRVLGYVGVQGCPS